MLSATQSSTAVQSAAAPPRTPPAAAPVPQQLAPARQFRIEAALQLVVTEFRAPDGEMRQSIPTPREIDAYRNPPLPAPDPELDVTG